MKIENQIKTLRLRRGITQEALTQYYEIQSDYESAIKLFNEELQAFDAEWNFTTGEIANAVRRHISRPEKKLI